MLCGRRNPACDRVGTRARGRAALRGRASRRENSHRPVRPRRQGHADVAADAAEGCAVMAAGDAISATIREAKSAGRPALVAYITAGFPRRETFLQQLAAVAEAADVVEIGVPFTDPMADGTTIQRSSRAALAQGVSLRWILS